MDANVILTLFNPSECGLTNFRGYDIKLLGNKFRSLEILQNRDGEPNVNIGLYFEGSVGTFRELPRADEFKNDPSLYQKWIR